ncbi:MAG: release factor glutamine methyltransferase [Elusimicrobia bacterium]|nr:MAG: release factor glutamine methyltransferase [Elusimicrobiota bacterium]KAF0154413.1 MAG: release factor glutamine methyltransferase [Elusimicrobiota bacterium]
MTSRAELLSRGRELLESAGSQEPEACAQWLLASALGMGRLEPLAEPGAGVSPAAERTFMRLARKKASGLPLSYVLGWHDFMGLRLKVGPGVLVPRPETEELTELCARLLKGQRGAGPADILDFCAGSGCVAAGLAALLPLARVTAVEKSARALRYAETNAAAHGGGRIRALLGDNFRGLGPFDAIAANPPYIPAGVIPGLDQEVLKEPRVALDGGGDGLKVVRMIAADAPAALRPGGFLAMEVCDGQAPAALELLSGPAWAERAAYKDFNGKDRFVYGRTNG